ncbi:hypothetical protein BDQ17DRAFT_206096 [Cyathus striatus]|nr:hypothetical protein BDQ17DRAFT_206096 [Cyathus striatus]
MSHYLPRELFIGLSVRMRVRGWVRVDGANGRTRLWFSILREKGEEEERGCIIHSRRLSGGINGSINLTKCQRDWREDCSSHFSVTAFASASAFADAYARYQCLEERKCTISPYLDAGRHYYVTYDQRPMPHEVTLRPISNLSPSRTSYYPGGYQTRGQIQRGQSRKAPKGLERGFHLSLLHFPSARPRSHSMPLNSREPKHTISPYVGTGRHPCIT